ncbi:CaiB/BaiF CoA transferase family protein [Proteocatella sphenisci]|uniref:CaiB/BaiF CoA transferase family protein n=1 Tax=Proteocatella sphenisci TaxID=181070 RepID=UPI000490A8A2|nr:CoA transferase [Proteocatella sphenisci]
MENEKLMLKGVKVVELATFVAAPSCTKLMADWGADVIKVEALFGDAIRGMGGTFNSPMTEDENPMYELENGNKLGIAIDIKDEKGMEVLFKLLENADVFVTNIREQSLAKSGLSYSQLKDKFPKLIHAHILGYGEAGPLKDKPGFDYTAYFARGGVSMSLMEKGTSPANTAAGFGDHYAGMGLAAGILAALYKQAKTGQGERVTLSLYHAALFGMGLMITTSQYGNEMPLSRKVPNNPLMTTYQCGDGRWIQLALIQYNKWFPKFCKVIDREDLINETRFNTITAVVNCTDELVSIVEKEMMKKNLDEWSALLEEADLPFEKLQTVNDILECEQAWANNYLFKTKYSNGNEGILVDTPVRFETMGIKEYMPAPKLGEHSAQILENIGYTADQISELQNSGVIK